MIYQNVSELIGGTPMMALGVMSRRHGLAEPILAKLEYFNPTGSVKDRVALAMINDAEARGLLSPGSVIIEPTSGNTGIGLAAVAASRGYSVILTMPETMSSERRSLLKAYGAKIVLTDGNKGMAGAIERARELAAALPGSFTPGQFTNPINPETHYRTTGPEIWRDAEGRVDVFVAGVGSGGTLSGAGRYLREQNPGVRIVAVEPDTSAVLSGQPAGSHALQGLGAGFVPDTLDTGVYDQILTVSMQDAYETGKEIAQCEGILVGVSSGAAIFAALSLAQSDGGRGKRIVALLPDTGERYLSTPMFER